MKKYLLAIIVTITIASCSEKSIPAKNIDPTPTALFAGNCAKCHGATGVEGKAPKLDHPEPKAKIVNIITNGEGHMPAFKNKLTEVEIDKIADFVLTLSAAKK